MSKIGNYAKMGLVLVGLAYAGNGAYRLNKAANFYEEAENSKTRLAGIDADIAELDKILEFAETEGCDDTGVWLRGMRRSKLLSKDAFSSRAEKFGDAGWREVKRAFTFGF